MIKFKVGYYLSLLPKYQNMWNISNINYGNTPQSALSVGSPVFFCHESVGYWSGHSRVICHTRLCVPFHSDCRRYRQMKITQFLQSSFLSQCSLISPKHFEPQSITSIFTLFGDLFCSNSISNCCFIWQLMGRGNLLRDQIEWDYVVPKWDRLVQKRCMDVMANLLDGSGPNTLGMQSGIEKSMVV